MTRSQLTKVTVLVILLALNTYIWWAVWTPQVPQLTVSFLDVGQGDSILIEGPRGARILIDGGPDRSVLRELSRELLPWERNLDLVIATHPDKDHTGGLADVFDRYAVKNFMDPGVPGTTETFARLEAEVASEQGAQSVTARRGMRVQLGGGAYADVLFPDRDESTQKETNDGSIVLHVVYGDTSFMLTGDLPSTYEDYLVSLAKQDDGAATELKTTVLKAGHHGSKYSTDEVWLAALDPQFVVISAGKGNTYGHPNPQAIERIEKEGATILSTIDQGTIDLVSDGKTVRQK